MNISRRHLDQVFILVLAVTLCFGDAMWGQKVTRVSFVDPAVAAPNASSESRGLGALYNKVIDINMRRSTRLLQNNSELAVAAYVVKWTLTSSGKEQHFYQTFLESNFIDDPKAQVHGYGLQAHDTRLIGPAFNVHGSETADPDLLSRLNPLPSASALVVTALSTPAIPSLDSVIYSDSTIEGQDESHLLERFTAERNGEHDAAVSVLIAKSRGETNAQIATRLASAISKGQNADLASPEGYYQAARGRWSQNCLTSLNNLPDELLMRSVRRSARLKAVQLTKE